LARLVNRQIRLSRPLRIVGSLAWQAGDLVGFGGLHVLRVCTVTDGSSRGCGCGAARSTPASRPHHGVARVPHRPRPDRGGRRRCASSSCAQAPSGRSWSRATASATSAARRAQLRLNGHLLLYEAIDGKKHLAIDTDTGARDGPRRARARPSTARRYSTASFGWRADYR